MRKLIIAFVTVVLTVGVLSVGALTPSADAATYPSGSATTRYNPLLGYSQTTFSNGTSATTRYNRLLDYNQTTFSNGTSATTRYNPLLGYSQTTYSGYGYGG
jgi:hypothetical protein